MKANLTIVSKKGIVEYARVRTPVRAMTNVAFVMDVVDRGLERTGQSLRDVREVRITSFERD